MDATARPEPLSIKSGMNGKTVDRKVFQDEILLMKDRFGRWTYKLKVKGAEIGVAHFWPSQEAALVAAQEHYQTF